jgi:hypothetical protein
MKPKMQLLDELCRKYDVSVEDVLAGGKSPNHIARVRWVFIWVLRKRDLSLPEIADAINLDHTSVKHALRRCPEEIDKDELSEAWLMSVTSTKPDTVAREIIDINTLLQGTVNPESLSPKQGAIAGMALNRLATLAAEAGKMLAEE